MKSLSQSEYGELRSLYESVYAQRFETILDEFTDEEVDELTEEIIEETVEEFFLECLEEGFDIDSVEETLCESLETSITALNESVLMEMNPYAPAGSKESQAYNKASTASKRSAERAAKRKEVIGKVKGAVKKVGSALKSGAKAAYKGAARGAGAAAGAAKRAGSVAKSEFKKGYQSASKSSSSDSESSDSGSSSSSSSSGSSSSGSTRRAVGGAVRKVGSLLKKGLKKAVGGAARAVSKGADKVATRLGEEAIQEDSRRMSNKQKTASVRQNIKAFGSNFTPPNNYDPDANRGKGEVLTRKQIEKKRRKSLRQEELEATGLFTTKEIEAIMEAEMSEGYKEIDAKKHGRMYDRYKKLRTAAMKDAADTGEASGDNRYKMGKMQGVISKSAENLRKKG